MLLRMLKRAVTIFSCLCVIGMSVVPSYAIPCCCKQKKHTCCQSAPAPAPSCCASMGEHAVPQEKNCSCDQQIFEKCSKCRCLEQIKVISAVHNSSIDDSERLASSFNFNDLSAPELKTVSTSSALALFPTASSSLSSLDSVLRC